MAETPFTLGLDLDGVTADYVHGLREVVAEDRGIDPETLTKDVDWYFEVWGLGSGEWRRYHELAVSHHRIFRTLPLIEGDTNIGHWQIAHNHGKS